MRSRAKEPPNCSTTGRSRSNSPTETATKPSSKQNETLLQQPASTVLYPSDPHVRHIRRRPQTAADRRHNRCPLSSAKVLQHTIRLLQPSGARGKGVFG